jgi:AcrR family transcriptional regulator
MPRRPDLTRRAELAAAAFEVLRTRGVQTSMRELADALGVKRPTLYFYFPDLGSVLETVLDQVYRDLGEVVLARVKSVDHPLDRLNAVVDATVDFHRQRPQLISGILQLWSVGGRNIGPLIDRERRIVAASRDALIADVRAGIARKQVLPCDAERVVDLVLTVVSGALVHQVLGVLRSDGALEELAARIIEPLRPQPLRPKKRKGKTKS